MGAQQAVPVVDCQGCKGPVNLVKESRVYLEGNTGSLKCLMQGVTDQICTSEKLLWFQSINWIGGGHLRGQGVMELQESGIQDLVTDFVCVCVRRRVAWKQNVRL